MAKTTVTKNKQGYGYKYTDIAQIHEYLESINVSYYQTIHTDENGNDFILTFPIVDGKELPPRRGCRVINATLSGKSNPAQEQGSALTYARRYSLLMAFGLATDDDDAESLTVKKEEKPKQQTRKQTPSAKDDFKMGEDQINKINSECERTGVPLETIEKMFGKISEMNKDSYNKCIHKLAITQDKEK